MARGAIANSHTVTSSQHLSELQTRAPPRALLRSSDAPVLVVIRIHTELAHCTFAVAAPSTWNSLPADIRLCENILTFKRHFKNPSVQTHLVLLCCLKRLCSDLKTVCKSIIIIIIIIIIMSHTVPPYCPPF